MNRNVFSTTPVVTAIIVSIGMGIYTKNMTGAIDSALYSSFLIFVSSITFLFLFSIIFGKKQLSADSGCFYKVCLFNILMFSFGTIYIETFEVVMIKISNQEPFIFTYHLTGLLIIILLLIAITVRDYKRIKLNRKR